MQTQNHCCLLVISVRSLIRPVPGAPKSFFQYTSKPVPALFTYYKTAASIWGWAWYRSVTNESVAQTDSVSRGTVPNGWRQGQCGTAAQSAAAHFDRRPLDKVLPDAFERYSAGMREKETWAILHRGRADRFTLEDPDVRWDLAKYPQRRTTERFARIALECIFLIGQIVSLLFAVCCKQGAEGAWLRVFWDLERCVCEWKYISD